MNRPENEVNKTLTASETKEMSIPQLTKRLQTELTAASIERDSLEAREQTILQLVDILKNRGESLDDFLPVSESV